ncbi:hypothetical protein MUP59_06350 [Candidatus Bathyarchaeota archaeon]|nr:hypothetical protein [Candidatus Bathyarchaeota archaeon]
MYKMYLTEGEWRNIDMGDVHAIVESMPAYRSLSQETKTEYFLAMMHFREGQEINPFQELMLTEGVILWKEKKFMDTKVTTWITPEMIDKTFSRMREIVEGTQKVQVTITSVKAEIEKGKVKMASNPDFKWGSNDTVRDTQIEQAMPDLIAKLRDAKLAEQKILDEKELVLLTIQQMNMMIDFFKAFHDSGE